MIYIYFFFFNTDISVTIYVIDLKFSVCILKVLPEESVSQVFDLGPSFLSMAKKRVTFCLFFAKQFSTFHKVKTRTTKRFPASISHEYMFKISKLYMEY